MSSIGDAKAHIAAGSAAVDAAKRALASANEALVEAAEAFADARKFSFVLRRNCACNGAETAHIAFRRGRFYWGYRWLRAQKLRRNSSSSCAETAHPYIYLPTKYLNYATDGVHFVL